MSTLDVKMRGLFATPVASVQLPDAQARNDALRAAILHRREQTASLQASNAGGWHSDRQIESWGGPAAGEVLAIARQLASHLTTDRQGRPLATTWTTQAWANVNGPGDSNVSHYHPGAFWSGAYYVDDGGCASDPSLGGEFEMLDPRGPMPGMYAPALRIAGKDYASAGAAESIRPRPGQMLFFPSWLMHLVRPYRGDRLRISIAFNFSL